MADFAADVRTAQEALREDRPEEAARVLKEHLWRDPGDADGCALLGAALARQGDLEGAILACERAHYLQPENPDLLFNYGLTLLAAGRAGDARMRFEAALRLDPTHAPSLRHVSSHAAPTALPFLIPGDAPCPALPGSTAAAPPPARAAAAKVEPPAPIAPAAPAAFTPGELPPGWIAPAVDPDWEPEEVPGLLTLARAAVQIWASQPLLWPALLLVPNAVVAGAAAVMPVRPEMEAAGWTVALGLAWGPLLTAVAGQWVHGRPFGEPWRLTPERWLRGTALALPYLVLAVGPLAFCLAARAPRAPDFLVLAALLLTAPFHALLAPALVLAATSGAGAVEAVGEALRLAGKRTWLHLAVMAALGLLLAGGLALFAWGYGLILQNAGEASYRVVQAVGLSLAESAWAVLIALCGLDALFVAGKAPEPFRGR